MIKPRFRKLDQFKTGQFTKLMLTKKALSQLAVRIALFTLYKMDYVKFIYDYYDLLAKI